MKFGTILLKVLLGDRETQRNTFQLPLLHLLLLVVVVRIPSLPGILELISAGYSYFCGCYYYVSVSDADRIYLFLYNVDHHSLEPRGTKGKCETVLRKLEIPLNSPKINRRSIGLLISYSSTHNVFKRKLAIHIDIGRYIDCIMCV